jgi:PIN domain nuclease of toxin-antitoxin system
VNLLLDTHALIWFLGGDPELRAEARTAIESADHAYVSSATIWEMAVKVARCRLEAPRSTGCWWPRRSCSV